VAHYGCGQQKTHIFDKQIGVNMKITLRDYFAARAMPVAIKTLMHDYTRDDEDWSWESYIDNDMLAELSYEMADAMLKARESNKQE
jgi:hypothetical protein